MGNIGRSSTGCGLCRKRKIKCDEGRPGCKRCAQIRKPCPGYPFQIQIDIRGEGEELRGDVVHRDYRSDQQQLLPVPINRIPRGPSPVTAPLRDQDKKSNVEVIEIKPEPTTIQTNTIQELIPHRRTPSPAPKYDIQHQSICYFVNLFCTQAERIYQFPVLDFVPSLLQEASNESPISLAATAVSRMTLADRYSGKDVRLQTGKEYVEALCVTNNAIRSSSESHKDETIVAVWLLGLYELVNTILSHGRSATSLEEGWQSHVNHIKGAKYLLKMRNPDDYRSPRSEKVYRVFKAAVQMRLHVLHSVLPQERSDDLKLDIYQEEHEFLTSPTAKKATSFFLSTARLMDKITDLLAQSDKYTLDGFSAKAKELLEIGEQMDTDMIGWNKSEPGWEMLRVQSSTSKSMWSLYPSHAMYYFYSCWVYLYWLRFLISRVKLYESLIEIVKTDYRRRSGPEGTTKPASVDFQLSRYRTIIQMSAAEIIGVTAYALGDIAADGTFVSATSSKNPSGGFSNEINVVATMQLVIPLKTLLRSEYTTPTQRGAIDLAIIQIGDGFRRQPRIVI